MSLTLSCNAILEGKWYTAGDALPFTEKELPTSFRKYIDRKEKRPKSNVRELNFLPNKLYQLDAEGRRIRQDVGELQAAIAQQEYAENVASAPPDQSVQDAIAQAQDDYHAEVEGEIANLECQAKQAEAAKEFVREQQNENVGNGEFDTFDTVTPSVEEMPKPKLIRKRYVRRGVLYRKAKDINVKLKRGEPVFVKNVDGEYERIGNVAYNGKLPVAYLKEEDEL